jgi:hypothetical protein
VEKITAAAVVEGTRGEEAEGEGDFGVGGAGAGNFGDVDDARSVVTIMHELERVKEGGE